MGIFQDIGNWINRNKKTSVAIMASIIIALSTIKLKIDNDKKNTFESGKAISSMEEIGDALQKNASDAQDVFNNPNSKVEDLKNMSNILSKSQGILKNSVLSGQNMKTLEETLGYEDSSLVNFREKAWTFFHDIEKLRKKIDHKADSLTMEILQKGRGNFERI